MWDVFLCGEFKICSYLNTICFVSTSCFLFELHTEQYSLMCSDVSFVRTFTNTHTWPKNTHTPTHTRLYAHTYTYCIISEAHSYTYTVMWHTQTHTPTHMHTYIRTMLHVLTYALPVYEWSRVHMCMRELCCVLWVLRFVLSCCGNWWVQLCRLQQTAMIHHSTCILKYPLNCTIH